MSQPFVCNTFSFIWKHPFVDCIPRLAELGFDAFEVLLTAPHLWPTDCDTAHRRRLVETLRVHSARVVSLNAGGFDNNLASPARNVREFAQQYLRDVIDLAADLGAHDVVVVPGQGRGLLPPSHEALLGWFSDSLAGLARHAESRDVRLLLENVPFSFLPRAGQLIEAVRDFPPERVGIVYDVANAVFARENPVEGLKAALPRLGLVHLSDTSTHTWRHDPVGRGTVPFKDIGAALREAHYAGAMALEIVTDAPETDLPDSATALLAIGYEAHRRIDASD